MSTPPGVAATGDVKTITSGDVSTTAGEEPPTESSGSAPSAANPPSPNSIQGNVADAGPSVMSAGTVAPTHDVHIKTFALLVGTRSNACVVDSGKTSVHINARLFWVHAHSPQEIISDEGIPSNGDAFKLRVYYKESESLSEWQDFPFQNPSPYTQGSTLAVDVSILTSDPGSVHYMLIGDVPVPNTVDHLIDESPSPIPSCADPNMEIEKSVNKMSLDHGILRQSNIPGQ